MSDISSFQKSFKGDIVTPADADYPAAIARWASNAQRNAKIVAFVKDAEDVALAIKFAKDNKLSLAIRGGGHSAAGASSSENGIVIDLSRHLNGVEIDPEQKIAIAGGGAIWATVDKNAIEHGLATAAGTVNHTGVGGLTLGGGFGWQTGSLGLVIDNLKQVTIVTANGDILTASSTENPDLFWGIRGGGCNFGVVTEFVYRLHPQRRKIYAGMLVFPPPAMEKVSEFSLEWWKEGQSGKAALMHHMTRGPDGNPAFMVSVFYNGSEEEGRSYWKPLFDIGPVADLTKEIPYEGLNSMFNDHTTHGPSTYLKGVSQTSPSFQVLKDTWDKMVELTEGSKVRILMNFEYFPMDKVMSVPAEETAFLRKRFGNVLSIVRWDDNTIENFEFARSASHQLTGIATKANSEVTDPHFYSNYDPEANLPQFDKEGQVFSDNAKSMFGPSYPKLQQLKRKYDPDMVFCKWFVVTPAAA